MSVPSIGLGSGSHKDREMRLYAPVTGGGLLLQQRGDSPQARGRFETTGITPRAPGTAAAALPISRTPHSA